MSGTSTSGNAAAERVGSLDAIVAAVGKPYFRDDSVVIYHADCRDILPKIPKVDLVLTDPPYGIGIADWDTFIAPQEWMRLYDAPLALVFPSIGRMFDYPMPTWVLSWVRDNSTQRNGTGGFNHWEPILLYGKARFSKDSIRALDHGNHNFHPSVKPLYLMRWLIEQSDAQNILDPFMGSGTTHRLPPAIRLPSPPALGRVPARRCRRTVNRHALTQTSAHSDGTSPDTPCSIFHRGRTSRTPYPTSQRHHRLTHPLGRDLAILLLDFDAYSESPQVFGGA